MYSETEKAYKKFTDVRKKFEGDWKKALEYINKRSTELVKGLDSDAKKAIEILKTQGGEYGKIVGSILEATYEAGAKSWEIVKQKIAKLRELAKNLSPELQKQFEELTNFVNKKASEYVKSTKDANDKIVKSTKETTDKMKSFWGDFFESVSKNPFWAKVISFGKSAWKGIQSVFKGGAKQGEKGIIARTKNAFSNMMSGASVGGLVGAGAAFLTDQLMQNEKIRKAMDKIFGVLQKILEPIADVIAPIIEAIAPIIESFKPIFQIIADILKPIAGAIKFIANIIAKINSLWTGILGKIWNGIKRIWDFSISFVKPIWSGMKKALDVIKSLVEAIANALKAVKKGASSIWDNTVGKVFKGIGRAIPFFHEGGVVKPLVAHSGMYIGNLASDEVPIVAQRGEYVINRRATRKHKPILDAINSGQEIKTQESIVINNTIHVHADNFDRRFVEDELLPILEDFHKRGKLRWE